MKPNIVDIIRSIIPDHDIHDMTNPEDGDMGQVELHGVGGLNLSVMFDIKKDMSIDYDNFCCAPFIRVNGDRQLGHWHNWPFDDMYMQVSPNQLKDLWENVNAYKI